jgi:hypothetical protein
MAILAIRASIKIVSDFEVIQEEVPVLAVEQNFWSAQYALRIPTLPGGTDRIEVTCLFPAEEVYFLSHNRQVLHLSSDVFPPFPVGCVLWLVQDGILWHVDLPKFPHLKLCRQGDRVTASFVVQDRLGAGLIFWGNHKLARSPVKERIYIRANRLKAMQEAIWLEPYPNGARSVVCLTDHPDFDTVAKLRLLYELFSKNDLRITKGVFPSSDPGLARVVPGLDVPEYKKYVDMLHESGSEIAYHGFSLRNHPPPLLECLRRIDMMSTYSPTTWIDHGVGDYLFSKDGVLNEGASLVEMLSKVGVKNYWSYTDVWENPARHLHMWTKRKLFMAFTNMLYFLRDKKRVRFPQLLYYGNSVLKNLLGQNHLRPILNAPWRMRAWKSVAAQVGGLNYYHRNPMVLYDLSGQCSFMSNERIWVFDTILLNHLAFQLRPFNVDLLCKQNGLLLAHCYFGHQKRKYGTMNCFVGDTLHPILIPEFIEDIKYISEKQSQRELVALSFAALRDALTNFANASLVHTENGWEINCETAVVASHRSLSLSRPAMQWNKEKVHYSEVKGQSVARIQESK